MYIAKYLSLCGICSRRKALELIKNGEVIVNGKVLTDLSYQVQKHDSVKFNNKIVKPLAFKYVLLNKPKNVITSLKDEKGRPTVMDLLPKSLQDVAPVGRLDFATTGLLLLTNDGDLSHKLSHPKSQMSKSYHVVLNKDLLQKDYEKIVSGFKLDGSLIKVDKIYFANKNLKKNITVVLHSGKNRIVRKIFEHFGYRIKKLDRFNYAGLSKRGLLVGTWRLLKREEKEALKNM